MKTIWGLFVHLSNTHTHTHKHKFSGAFNYTHIHMWLKDSYSWNILFISRKFLIDIIAILIGKIKTENEANIQRIKIIMTQTLTAVVFLAFLYGL